MFEYATRNKLRFNFKGQISSEDLWDLPLKDLDTIYKGLRKETKSLEDEEDSLLETKNNNNKDLETKLKIVKHIFTVKLDEKNAKENELAKKARKQQLLSIIDQKQNEELMNSSIEDLRKMLEEL